MRQYPDIATLAAAMAARRRATVEVQIPLYLPAPGDFHDVPEALPDDDVVEAGGITIGGDEEADDAY